MNTRLSEQAIWLLALEDMPGVGRRTAARIHRYFPDYETLLSFPVDQIQARLRRTPNATELRQQLLDEPAMRERLKTAHDTLVGYANSGITVLPRKDSFWPESINLLPPKFRPNLLYLFGNASALSSRCIALFAHPPIEGEVFERAQELMKFILENGGLLATGLHSGFDTVAIKLSTDRPSPLGSIMVVNRGLGQVESAFRSSALLSLRSGGVLVSPFRPDHGPFPHDDRERLFLQAALASAVVICDPTSGTYALEPTEWAKSVNKSVFAISDGSVPPEIEGIHILKNRDDFNWITTVLDRSGQK